MNYVKKTLKFTFSSQCNYEHNTQCKTNNKGTEIKKKQQKKQYSNLTALVKHEKTLMNKPFQIVQSVQLLIQNIMD